MVALKLWVKSTGLRTYFGKQERRGGIETQINTVTELTSLTKQERRGGIETPTGIHPIFRTSLKQERRGGIETTIAARAQAKSFREAGTPWWH